MHTCTDTYTQAKTRALERVQKLSLLSNYFWSDWINTGVWIANFRLFYWNWLVVHSRGRGPEIGSGRVEWDLYGERDWRVSRMATEELGYISTHGHATLTGVFMLLLLHTWCLRQWFKPFCPHQTQSHPREQIYTRTYAQSSSSLDCLVRCELCRKEILLQLDCKLLIQLTLFSHYRHYKHVCVRPIGGKKANNKIWAYQYTPILNEGPEDILSRVASTSKHRGQSSESTEVTLQRDVERVIIVLNVCTGKNCYSKKTQKTLEHCHEHWIHL